MTTTEIAHKAAAFCAKYRPHLAPQAHTPETTTMSTTSIASALTILGAKRTATDDAMAAAIANAPKTGDIPAPKAARAKASDVKKPAKAAKAKKAAKGRKPAAKTPAKKKAAKTAPKKAKAPKATAAPAKAAGGRKAEVIGMMKGANGTTVDKICAKTGMLPHSARALISGIAKTEMVKTSKEPGEPTVYRI